MILGETGTGKEMLARYVHAHSDRAGKPFVPVDCSALTDTLFESELFGHVKGAFTGASRDSLGFIRAADSGTLFMDEIGDLSLHLQAKLLRVVQERLVIPVGDTRPRPVDVRIIVATNRDLQKMVGRGTFRQDLLFRLNVVVLTLPPLRERREDIVPLGNHFLRLQAHTYGETPKCLAPEATEALRAYSWPGNVRELANVMEHAHVVPRGEVISLSDLPQHLRQSLCRQVRTSQSGECASCRYRQGAGALGGDPLPEGLSLEEMEKQMILEALKRTNYCKAASSRLLGINIQRLSRHMARLGIPIPRHG
jgi:transcriptional regulator with PAS, ATPase and Fis domain